MKRTRKVIAGILAMAIVAGGTSAFGGGLLDGVCVVASAEKAEDKSDEKDEDGKIRCSPSK